MIERVGTYYYFFPTYKQGKKILWNGLDRDGFKFTDHIPEAIRKRTDNTEMLIETINGSILQIVGTDRYDSVRGTNPIGCIFSEYSYQDPNAWNTVRPILAENGGWAVFNYTPAGDNHGKDLFELAQQSKGWFCQRLTVDDTHVITPEMLQQEKEEIVRQNGDDSLFMQEYYCSFDAPVVGSYYGKWMTEAEREGRVLDFGYETNIPVHTVWDLGVGDAMSIWFVQIAGNEIRLIDYMESEGEGLNYYFKEMREKPYVYGRHIAPHDIKVTEMTSGITRIDTASSLGVNFEVAPNVPIDDGIQAVRSILNRCYFHKTNCERGISALKNYKKLFDDKRKTYKNAPDHDWSSHAADAFRYLAVSGLDGGAGNGNPEVYNSKVRTTPSIW